MPTKTSVQNNFTKGLLTEYSGLNFPENACTETSNCVFQRTGSVTRRLGLDYETNFTLSAIDRTNKAISTYRWLNAGGDGETQLLVVQVGNTLYFYESSAATSFSPLSAQQLSSTVSLDTYIVANSTNTVECQFSDGNGYLFVYNTNMDPIYCTLSAGVITANKITVQIRDFVGDVEPGVLDNTRPSALSLQHHYNLLNQGWSDGPAWSVTSNTGQVYQFQTPVTWTFYGVSSSSIAMVGDIVNLHCDGFLEGEAVFPAGMIWQGVVVNYNQAGGSMTINVTANIGAWTDAAAVAAHFGQWVSADNTFTIYASPQNAKITLWNTDVGNYPSNADVWWQFKDDTNVFNPAVTIGNVTLNSGPAPKGYFILNAFNQDRSAASGLPGINPVATNTRPGTGCWFQGRVWYTGVNASVTQQDLINPPSNTLFYTWTESIYFSQIINDTSQFGKCYETNDPTSEDLFDLLPTDGGVIQIQGCGSIFKLFPIQTGVLVFAANGIWFITGSSGLGFTANDYAITKVSGVESISSTSYVNVQGLPLFWNEDGIYAVTPASSSQRNYEQQGLQAEPITLTTIKSFYNDIPLSSKKHARGYYNPITNIIQWVYRSTEATDLTSTYEFDSILNFNTLIQSFYPWTISNSKTTPYVHDVIYIVGPGGSTSPDPVFKYLTSVGATNPIPYNFTFSEEKDMDFVDWASAGTSINYVSDFTSGYALHGDAIRKWNPSYVFVYQNLTPPTLAPPRPMKAFIFGDEGFLKTSGNLGSVWSLSNITRPTVYDIWNDLAMAPLDNDQSTMVGFDFAYLGSSYSSRLNLSLSGGVDGSWTQLNPSGAAADNTSEHPQVFHSGSVSKNGNTILALPSTGSTGNPSWPDLSLSYPRISRNQGVSWEDITALGSGRAWLKSCFNEGAMIIYTVSNITGDAIISKSTDGGFTWTDLTTIFLGATDPGANAQDIKCSADGSTVLYVDIIGDVFLSKDGGASWTFINSFIGFPPDFNPVTILPSQVLQADSVGCGVSADGKTLILSFSVFTTDPTRMIADYPNHSAIFISTDGGNTWTQPTPPGVLNGAPSVPGIMQAVDCNVSPNGAGFIIAYQNISVLDFRNFQADISIDGGNTWINSQFPYEDTSVAAYFF